MNVTLCSLPKIQQILAADLDDDSTHTSIRERKKQKYNSIEFFDDHKHARSHNHHHSHLAHSHSTGAHHRSPSSHHRSVIEPKLRTILQCGYARAPRKVTPAFRWGYMGTKPPTSAEAHCERVKVMSEEYTIAPHERLMPSQAAKLSFEKSISRAIGRLEETRRALRIEPSRKLGRRESSVWKYMREGFEEAKTDLETPGEEEDPEFLTKSVLPDWITDHPSFVTVAKQRKADVCLRTFAKDWIMWTKNDLSELRRWCRSVPYLRHMPASIRDRLLLAMHCRVVPVGKTVFRRGSPADRIYIVKTGKCVSVRLMAGAPAREWGPGSVFGEPKNLQIPARKMCLCSVNGWRACEGVGSRECFRRTEKFADSSDPKTQDGRIQHDCEKSTSAQEEISREK
eukprot:58814_1